MNLSRLVTRWALLVAVGMPLVAAPTAASAGAEPAAVAARLDPARARMNQRVFDAVWHEVQREYYDPDLHGVDWREARRVYRPEALDAADDRALYRVLNAMLDLLDDDHAGVSAPAVARRQDQLRQPRAILGVTLRREEAGDSYLIERVRRGSPAEEAGVLVGWRLRSDETSAWTPEDDVVSGAPIELTFTDPQGAAHLVTLTPRRMDPLPAFTVDRSRSGVVVLRVEGFESGLGRWMGSQLADLAPDTKIVLDLRDNPGGRLLEADAVLSCFLPSDTAWATRTSRNGRRVPLKVETGCGDLTAPVPNPVAVLVNSQSRSAAELTPAALQEAARAVVVGEPTAGAVLISQETRLPDGGRLTLSRADFVTRGGVRLEKRGVTPDLAAATTREQLQQGRDPALDAALRALDQREPVQSAVALDVQAP